MASASFPRSLLLLVALAAALRVSYLLQYLSLPFFEAPLYDSVIYLRQVAAIARGDFVDASLLAMSPLYGYFLLLSGVRHAFLAPIALQLGLGLLTLVLVFHTARALRNELAGLAAAAFCAGYGLLLHYETKFLTETLSVALAAAALFVFSSEAVRVGKPVASLVAGVLVGFTVLARASLLFAPPLFVLAALMPWRPGEAAAPWRARLRRTGGVVLGLVLTLGAHAAFNYAHTGLLVPVIMVSQTVERSAGRDVRGELSILTGDGSRAGPADVVRQAEERLRRKDSSSVRLPHIDVVGYLEHAPSKLFRTLSDLEMTVYDYGYYGERRELSVLRAMPVSFGMLLLFGVLGAAVLVRTQSVRALVPFLPWLLAPLVTTTLFHPSSRYRLAMILPLLVWTGVAVSELWRRRRTRSAQVMAAIALLASVALGARTVCYALRQPALWHLSVAEAAAKKGDVGLVAARIARARAVSGQDAAVEERVRYILTRLPRSARRNALPHEPAP